MALHKQNLNDGHFASQIFSNAESLFNLFDSVQILAIDIPIGLPDAGPRRCDPQARKMLGPKRGSSVFSAPIRPALIKNTREEAQQIQKAIDGRGISCQAWGIYPKIVEVDEVLKNAPELQERIREIHPELSFMAMNGGIPISEPKKKSPGVKTRQNLIENHIGADAFELVRKCYLKKWVANDDINGAFAALWTAERIYKGETRVIPEKPEIDSAGLRMEMWF